jgi:hypothetical protein
VSRKPKAKPVSDADLRALLPFAPAVGATQAFDVKFPQPFESVGFKPREASRNTALGLTVTRPSPDLVYFGVAYDDHKDGLTDEDIFALDIPAKEMSYYGRGWVEKIDPRFKGTHHGDKPYLRDDD